MHEKIGTCFVCLLVSGCAAFEFAPEYGWTVSQVNDAAYLPCNGSLDIGDEHIVSAGPDPLAPSVEIYRTAADVKYHRASAGCSIPMYFRNGVLISEEEVNQLRSEFRIEQEENRIAQERQRLEDERLRQARLEETRRQNAAVAERQRQEAEAERQRQQAQEVEAERLRLEIERRWMAYSARQKSVLEQVLNYTATANVDGTQGRYWVSGENGTNKCLMTQYIENSQPTGIFDIVNSVVTAGAQNRTDKIDIRQFDAQGFRIRVDTKENPFVTLSTGADAEWMALAGVEPFYEMLVIGDEQTRLEFPVSNQDMTRIRDAWSLAVSECPGKSAAPF